jgi:hypothetical protein
MKHGGPGIGFLAEPDGLMKQLFGFSGSHRLFAFYSMNVLTAVESIDGSSMKQRLGKDKKTHLTTNEVHPGSSIFTGCRL